jgi:hypothetical protein
VAILLEETALEADQSMAKDFKMRISSLNITAQAGSQWLMLVIKIANISIAIELILKLSTF